MIYKPSQLQPNLEEIDANEANTFACQINTSGESIKAYKPYILSEDGKTDIYKPDLPTLLETPVSNKGTLKIENLSTDMENGNDYQWGLRVYNNIPYSPNQPNTLVCEGWLVGSTTYVVWCRIKPDEEFKTAVTNYILSKELQQVEIATLFSAYSTSIQKSIAALLSEYQSGAVLDSELTGRVNKIGLDARKEVLDMIVYDRYIEISIDESNIDRIILTQDEINDGKTYPTAFPYVERQKIEWVEKDLGTDEDIVKIETTDKFEYNFADGTPFSIYQCSSEHTVNSFFIDPNSNINLSDYVIIYATTALAYAAKVAGEDPSTTSPTIPWVFGPRKILGYSSDTGEVRVGTAFEYAPTNGMVYRIFEYDAVNKKYEEKLLDETKILGYHIASGASYYNNQVINQNIGEIYYAKGEKQIYSGETLKTKYQEYFTANPNNCIDLTSPTKTYHCKTVTEADAAYTEASATLDGFYPYVKQGFLRRNDSYTYALANTTDTYASVTMPAIDPTTGAAGTGTETKYIQAPTLINQVDLGTDYFYDINLTQYKGTLGLPYTRINDIICTIKINSVTYGIYPPITDTVFAGTVFYATSDLKEIVGTIPANTTATYTYVNSLYSTIVLTNNVYYIKTPTTGQAPVGTTYYEYTSGVMGSSKGVIQPTDGSYPFIYASQTASKLGESNSYTVVLPQNSDVGYYSANDTTWSTCNLNVQGNWSSVCYGNNRYVAIAQNMPLAIYTSDMTHWNTAQLPYNLTWAYLAFGNGKFVAITKDSQRYAYSYDGIVWTGGWLPKNYAVGVILPATTEQYDWVDLIFENGKFILLSTNSSYGFYSVDGEQWTQFPLYTATLESSAYIYSSYNWSQVVYGNGTYISFATYRYKETQAIQGLYIAYSTDGMTWNIKHISLVTIYAWNHLGFINGRFILLSDTLSSVLFSSDGLNWDIKTNAAFGTDCKWNTVFNNSNSLVALKDQSTGGYTTVDGLTWTAYTIADAAKTWVGGCYARNDNYVATPVMYGLPNGTEYYTDSTTTQKYGIIALSATVENWKTSSFTYYTGQTMYIHTPTTSWIGNGTPYYYNNKFKALAGIFGLKYNFITPEYSSVTIGNDTRYIKTPTSNYLPYGVRYYTDNALSILQGITGAQYTYVNNKYSIVFINSIMYYVATPTIGTVYGKVNYYLGPDLLDKAGSTDNLSETPYTRYSGTVSAIEISSNTYYIQTPTSGAIAPGTTYYSDSVLTQEVDVVGNYTNSVLATYYTQNVNDKYISQFVMEDINYFVETLASDDVDNGMTLYNDINLSIESGVVSADMKWNACTLNPIATAHDATQSYAKDAYVTYENDLYQCKAAIEAKAWDVNDWILADTSQFYWSTTIDNKTYYTTMANNTKVVTNTVYYKDMDLSTSSQLGTIDSSYLLYDYTYTKNLTTTLNGITFYIKKPLTGLVENGTKYYDSTALTTYIGTIYSGYFSFNNKSISSIILQNNTYYIHTPLAGTTTEDIAADYGNSVYSYIYVNDTWYLVYTPELVAETITGGVGSSAYYVVQMIGGLPISTDDFVTLSNVWNKTTGERRIFIQPNINIKSDWTNPNEIVLSNKTRIDINKLVKIDTLTGKETDITFNKLDNTQWLLEDSTISLAEADMDFPRDRFGNISPQTTYKVYTDFMDSMPNGVIYARTTPSFTIQCRDLHSADLFDEIQETEKYIYGYRDIEFNSQVIFGENEKQQVKCYQYSFYEGALPIAKKLISQTEWTYTNEITWNFRGLQTGTADNPHLYTIKLTVTNENGKTFSTYRTFGVYYSVNTDIVPIDVAYDCHEKAVQIQTLLPLTALSTDLTETFEWVDIASGRIDNVDRFVIVAKNNNIIKYGDETYVHETAMEWHNGTLPLTRSWSVLKFVKDKFVLLAEDAEEYLYSFDGIEWYTESLPMASKWTGLVYAEAIGKIIAISRTSRSYLISDDGITWTIKTLDKTILSQNIPKAIEYGYQTNNDVSAYCLVMLMQETSSYLYSLDGITWIAKTFPVTANWCKIEYGKVDYGLGRFVCLNDSTTTALYSFDGLTWSTTTIPVTNSWTVLNFDGFQFIAVAPVSTKMIYSVDAITWVTREITDSEYDYSNAHWVACASDRPRTIMEETRDILIASDMSVALNLYKNYWQVGATCFLYTYGTATLPVGVTFKKSAYGLVNEQPVFVALGTASGTLPSGTTLTAQVFGKSNDGVTWGPEPNGASISQSIFTATATYPLDLDWANLIFGKNKFVAVGYGLNPTLQQSHTFMYMSLDGETWSLVNLSTTVAAVHWTHFVYANGKFMLVNLTNNVLTTALAEDITVSETVWSIHQASFTNYNDYDNLHIYVLGDLCCHLGNVYICSVMSATGEWDETKWTLLGIPTLPAFDLHTITLNSIGAVSGNTSGYTIITNGGLTQGGFALYSADGINWSIQLSWNKIRAITTEITMSLAMLNTWSSMVYDQGVFAVIGPDYPATTKAYHILASSTDGQTWAPVIVSNVNTGSLKFLVSTQTSGFIGIDTENTVWYSFDGKSWITVELPLLTELGATIATTIYGDRKLMMLSSTLAQYLTYSNIEFSCAYTLDSTWASTPLADLHYTTVVSTEIVPTQEGYEANTGYVKTYTSTNLDDYYDAKIAEEQEVITQVLTMRLSYAAKGITVPTQLDTVLTRMTTQAGVNIAKYTALKAAAITAGYSPRVLNYTTVNDAAEPPITLPEDTATLTQFRITSELVANIPSNGFSPVFSYGHENEDESITEYKLVLYDINKYIYNDVLHKWTVNSRPGALQWYKLDDDGQITGDPLSCFVIDGEYTDKYTISDYYGSAIRSSQYLRFVLQSSEDYEIVDTLPETPQYPEKKYVARAGSVINNQAYTRGVYNYSDGWKLDTQFNYIFIASEDQLPDDLTAEDLNTPISAYQRTEIGTNFIWSEGTASEPLVWVEENLLDETKYVPINAAALEFNNLWLTMYFVINNSELVTNTESCYITINKGGKML